MRLLLLLTFIVASLTTVAQDRDALLQSGYSYLAEAEYELGRQQFDLLLQYDKRDVEGQLGMAICLFRLEDLDGADDLLDDVLFRAEEDARGHYWKARISFQRKHYNSAYNGFTTALRLDSLLTSLYCYAGASAYQLGLDSVATNFLTEALAESEALDYSQYYLGQLALEKSDFVKAESHFQAAITIETRIPRFHVGLGDTDFDQADYLSAFNHYQDASTRNPNYAEAWFRQAEALLQAGLPKRALVAHNTAKIKMKADGDLKWQSVRIQYAMGNYEVAKAEILAHHREIGRRFETDVMMARIYSALDDHHTSYMLYQSVRKVAPERLDLGREFAAEAFVLSKMDIALTLFAWCVEASGGDVFDVYNQAVVQAKTGDTVSACVGFQHVLEEGSNGWGEKALLAMEQFCN